MKKIKVRRMKFDMILANIAYCMCIPIGSLLLTQEKKETYWFYMGIMTASLMLILFSNQICDDTWAKKLSYIIGVIIMMSLFAFRAQIGKDDFEYQSLFLSAGRFGFWNYLSRFSLEKGYLALNWLVYQVIGDDYNIAQVVITGISFSFWGKAIWDNRHFMNMAIAAFLVWTNYYFLILAAALTRIFLASGIMFWGYKFIIKKKFKEYVITVLIASIFHRSALIMLIMLILYWNQEILYRYWKRVVFIMTFAIPIGLAVVAKFLVPLLPSDKYAGYAIISGNLLDSVVEALDVFPILILWLILENNYKKDYQFEYSVSMILSFISCILKMCTMFGFGRCVYYTNVGIIMLMSSTEVMEKRKNSWEQFLPMIVILYGFIYLFYSCFLNIANSKNLFPYISFLERI